MIRYIGKEGYSFEHFQEIDERVENKTEREPWKGGNKNTGSEVGDERVLVTMPTVLLIYV